jgi:hypothetical protein
MQLIYRGFVFCFRPTAIALPKAMSTNSYSMVYRGVDCVYQKPVEPALMAPKVINWRFAQVCQNDGMLVPAHA